MLGLTPDAIQRGLRSFPGLAHRMEQVGRRGRQIGLPPGRQVRIALSHGRETLHRHADQLLLHQEVEELALLHVALVLQNRLSLHRRPGDAIQVTQLKAPLAVDEILQTALTEVEVGGKGHGVLCVTRNRIGGRWLWWRA